MTRTRTQEQRMSLSAAVARMRAYQQGGGDDGIALMAALVSSVVGTLLGLA